MSVHLSPFEVAKALSYPYLQIIPNNIYFNTKLLSWILAHEQYLMLDYEVTICKLSLGTILVLLKHAVSKEPFPCMPAIFSIFIVMLISILFRARFLS